MHLFEELRAARISAGLSQAELAERAGIPRNQIVRAEKGENITLDTLRKIAVHLPLERLTLLEKLKLDFDYLPEPEKLYFGALENVTHALESLGSALRVAMAARAALAAAKRTDRDQNAPPGFNKNDELLLLQHLSRVAAEAVAELTSTPDGGSDSQNEPSTSENQVST